MDLKKEKFVNLCLLVVAPKNTKACISICQLTRVYSQTARQPFIMEHLVEYEFHFDRLWDDEMARGVFEEFLLSTSNKGKTVCERMCMCVCVCVCVWWLPFLLCDS